MDMVPMFRCSAWIMDGTYWLLICLRLSARDQLVRLLTGYTRFPFYYPLLF